MTEITHANRQIQPPPECPADLVFVPEPFRQPLLNQDPHKPQFRPPGITATEYLLRNRFLVANTFDRRRQINSQLQYLQHHQITQDNFQPACYTTLTHARRPWSHVAIDFITDLPNSQGNTTILTIVDRFSKACASYQCLSCLLLLRQPNYCQPGVSPITACPTTLSPIVVLNFTSRVWSAFFKSLNVNISLTSGYHP